MKILAIRLKNLASLAGPTALLGQFSLPDQTLASPPRTDSYRVVSVVAIFRQQRMKTGHL